MKAIIVVATLFTGLLLALVANHVTGDESRATKESGPAPPPIRTGYAPVNGINLYYEVYGSGEPLLLLHGGLASTESWNAILPQLAAGRQVFAVDLQAHGRTADVDRPLNYEFMAGDIAALIRYLGFQKA